MTTEIQKLDPLRDNFLTMVKKHNALVDAVNALIKENNIHEKQIDRLQSEKVETPAEKVPESIKLYVCADGSVYDNLDIAKSHAARAENVQDKFAEQKRWIGKLCKFWCDSNKPEKCVYDVLRNVFDLYQNTYPFQCRDGLWWKYCEPVSEDLIYKGGDNE